MTETDMVKVNGDVEGILELLAPTILLGVDEARPVDK